MPLHGRWAHQQVQRRFFICWIRSLRFQIQSWLRFSDCLAGRFDGPTHAMLHHLLMRSGERGLGHIVRLHSSRLALLKTLSFILHKRRFRRRMLQYYRNRTRRPTGFGGDNGSLPLCCYGRLRIARPNSLDNFPTNTILHWINRPTQRALHNWLHRGLRRLWGDPALQDPREK